VIPVTCPRCKGVGIDPERDGECLSCQGDGVVDGQPPCMVCTGLADVGYGVCMRCRAGSDEP
jgi:hypothetical protein